jgi:alpha-L-fucosidase
MSRMKRRKFLKSAGAAAVAGSVIRLTGCFPLFGSWAQAAGNARRIAEWRNQRFGMFIHWGPVSLKGTEIGWSRGAQVPVEEYDSLYRQFNPALFDAGEWVRIARETGMKYLVFTTKHHDGFCMWDTKQTDYNIMRSPFGRDVVKELAAACRRQGIAFSTYHSVCDWHHPDFPLTSPGGRVRREVSNLDRYEQYLRAQVKELITGYGPLQVLWFDVPQQFGEQRGLALEQWARSLQPDIIINNRSGARGDYDTPEQRVGKYQEDRPWETCMTLCQQWAWKPNDDMKSLKECIQALVLCAGGDGNLLFNVGPMPDGRIEPRQVERLREMGAWLAKYGESIYGTRGGPWKPTRAVASTRKGNIIYVHVLRWDGDVVTLPDIPLRVQAARVSGGGKVEVRQANGELTLRVPPAERHEIDTLVRLELSGSAMSLKAVDLPSVVKATASNVFRNRTSEYGPEMAFDNDPQTRWATDAGTRQAWIAAEFPRPLSIQRVRIEEALEQRVQKFEFQYLDGGQWQTIFTGTTIGRWFQKTFAPVRGQAFRLNILDATEGPTITDIELFEK